MSDGQKAVLEERLHKNYEDFLAQLQGKSVSELIAMAPEITAAKHRPHRFRLLSWTDLLADTQWKFPYSPGPKCSTHNKPGLHFRMAVPCQDTAQEKSKC